MQIGPLGLCYLVSWYVIPNVGVFATHSISYARLRHACLNMKASIAMRRFHKDLLHTSFDQTVVGGLMGSQTAVPPPHAAIHHDITTPDYVSEHRLISQ